MGKKAPDITSQSGFTLIELLIASGVFSVILLLCAFALLRIGQVYYKGVTQSRTQEVARSIMDDIAQSIQLGGGTVQASSSPEPSVGSGTTENFCVGTKNYNYITGFQLSDNPASTPSQPQSHHVLVVDSNAPSCPIGPNLSVASLGAGLPSPSTQRELLTPGMQLTNLVVKHDADPNKPLWQISVTVVNGDNSMLSTTDPHNPRCESNLLGVQFCAVSSLTTVVEKRI